MTGLAEHGVFSKQWHALQREAQLAGQQVAIGITALGRANHQQPGLYTQAFFGLSIGIERIGKLVLVADYALQNDGRLPPNNYLKRYRHDLVELLKKCEEIAGRLDSTDPWRMRPPEQIHQEIILTLHEFAKTTRYYNLDYVTGSLHSEQDPIERWRTVVGSAICERHYSRKQRERDEKEASELGAATAVAFVIDFREDQTTLPDLEASATYWYENRVVQKYGRLYTLQIVRWLAFVLTELSFMAARRSDADFLLGLDEPFIAFRTNDARLRDRKSWTIYF